MCSKSISGAAKTVPELLRSTAGIQIKSRPNAGGNEDLTVKLRGHDCHYTVLVDGVPQAMAGVMGGSYVNWNAIPLSMVERIEITKGAKSAAYGQTEGGVINIITKADAQGGELRLQQAVMNASNILSTTVPQQISLALYLDR